MTSLAGVLLALAALALPVACAPHDAQRVSHFVDLTHAFDAETLYWPTESGFHHERGFEGVTEAGYFYSAHRFRAAEHGGTHLDAPIHFFAEGRSVEALPLDRLVGDAVVVDVREACARDRDYRVSVSDFEAWEVRHGAIASGSIVLLRTGFGTFWPDPARYLGTALRGDEGVRALRFPGLHPKAARWLVDERRARAVGLDTASIDVGRSTDFEAHQVLAARQVPVFENLANLGSLPPRGFRVIALPMKIRGGSGAPLRIVAELPGPAPGKGAGSRDPARVPSPALAPGPPT